MHVNSNSMELPILYSKGSKVEISKQPVQTFMKYLHKFHSFKKLY